MSLAPSPSSSRGEIVLQPAYFTSSAFVQAARTDVDALIQEYGRQYARYTVTPFTLFKDIWQRYGWTWIQFKVFDTRSRAAFLKVMMRLFSERIGAGEPPLSRAAALFGLYTIYLTQPSTSAPPLYSAARIQVTCDLYRKMMMLPDALDGERLHSLRPYVIYVQASLLQAQVFDVLPRRETHPLSPRTLPREVVTTSMGQGRKSRGRPCKGERVQRARDALVALDERGGAALPPSVTRTWDRYAAERSALVDAIGRDGRWESALRAANGAVAERMEMLKLELLLL